MKTLITATDFSKASLNAVNYAADLAAAINAKLEVLHVMQVPVATVISDDIYGLEEEVYEQRTHKLQLLKQRLEKRTANRIPIVCSVIEGHTNSTIKDFAEDKKPLAIILGSKHVSNLQNVVFGSVALHTAKHSQFPVLHQEPPGSHAQCGYRATGAGYDHNGRAVLQRGPGPVLGR